MQELTRATHSNLDRRPGQSSNVVEDRVMQVLAIAPDQVVVPPLQLLGVQVLAPFVRYQDLFGESESTPYQPVVSLVTPDCVRKRPKLDFFALFRVMLAPNRAKSEP